ncbi:MAG: hypothetical protein KCHDKBKB_02717 [Elusimicrobia bacterium]|nr:hypothetical protein [Elusimicrobiota bacterium]
MVVCLVYASTNGLLAHALETNFWKERQAASAFNKFSKFDNSNEQSLKKWELNENQKLVPESIDQLNIENMQPLLRYGTIRKIRKPRSPNSQPRTIIHIQDIHMDAEAQKNIAAAIRELITKNQLSCLALEGAFGPIDMDAFRTFPRPETVRTVADYLLRENKIAGPLYAVLTASSISQISNSKLEKFLPFVTGIDDKAHYQANVRAVRESSRLKGEVRRRLDGAKQFIRQEKRKTFNQTLLDFDGKIELYSEGKIEMGVYVELVSRHLVDLPFVVSTFLEAIRLERSLNFTQVEHERSLLLNDLSKKLSTKEAADLAKAGAAFRTGAINHATFYQYLKDLCHEQGWPLARYKAMDDYFRYILLADSVDVDALMTNMASLETTVYNLLCKTPQERELVAASKRLSLMEKLVDFSLTRDEWEAYKKTVSGNQALGAFEDFYREAEIRDVKMAINLLKQLSHSDSSPRFSVGRLGGALPQLPVVNSVSPASGEGMEVDHSLAVLVTGGFHSRGIDRRLVEAGHTVITFVPKITQIEMSEGPVYLSVFTQQKTPLDTLFAGEKLFLSLPVANPSFRRQTAVLMAADGLRAGLDPKLVSDWFRAVLRGISDWSVKGYQSLINGIQVTVSSGASLFRFVLAYDQNNHIQSLAVAGGLSKIAMAQVLLISIGFNCGLLVATILFLFFIPQIVGNETEVFRTLLSGAFLGAIFQVSRNEVVEKIAEQWGNGYARRHANSGGSWAAHLLSSKRMILEGADGVSLDRAVILGSSDVKEGFLDDLAQKFQRITLVDIDIQSMNRAKGALSEELQQKIDLVVWDISGGVLEKILTPGLDLIEKGPNSKTVLDRLVQLFALTQLDFVTHSINELKSSYVVSSVLVSQLVWAVLHEIEVAFQGRFGSVYTMNRDLTNYIHGRDEMVRQVFSHHVELLGHLMKSSDSRAYFSADTTSLTNQDGQKVRIEHLPEGYDLERNIREAYELESTQTWEWTLSPQGESEISARISEVRAYLIKKKTASRGDSSGIQAQQDLSNGNPASLLFNALVWCGFSPENSWVKAAGTAGFVGEILGIAWLVLMPDLNSGWYALFIVLVILDSWLGARANKVRGSPDVSYLFMVSAYLIAIFLPAFHAQLLPTVLHLIQVTLFVLAAGYHVLRDWDVIWGDPINWLNRHVDWVSMSVPNPFYLPGVISTIEETVTFRPQPLGIFIPIPKMIFATGKPREPGSPSGLYDLVDPAFVRDLPEDVLRRLEGKTNWSRVEKWIQKELIALLFEIVRKSDVELDDIQRLSRPYFSQTTIPALGKTLGGLYNYYDRINDSGLTTIIFLLSEVGLIEKQKPANRIRSLNELVACVRAGQFSKNGGEIALPWGQLRINVIRELVEDMTAAKIGMPLVAFRALTLEEKKRHVLELTTGDIERCVVPSINQKLGGLLNRYSLRAKKMKNIKTAKWLLFEDIGYLPRDLPPLNRLARSQDLKKLLDCQAIAVGEIPWETVFECNPEFIARLLKELAAVVVYGAQTEEEVEQRVLNVTLPNITGMVRGDYENNPLPGLGRNIGPVLSYIQHHLQQGETANIVIGRLFSVRVRKPSAIYGREALQEAVAINGLGNEFWGKIPSRTIRLLLHELSIVAQKPIDKLVEDDYLGKVLPVLECTLGGLYVHFQKNRSGVVTRLHILRSAGFIMDIAGRALAIRTLQEGLNTNVAKSNRYAAVVRSISNFLKEEHNHQPTRLDSEIDLDPMLAAITEEIEKQDKTSVRKKDLEAWLGALNAYSALVDTQEWMPKAFESPTAAAVLPTNRISSLEDWANGVNYTGEQLYSQLPTRVQRLAVLALSKQVQKPVNELSRQNFQFVNIPILGRNLYGLYQHHYRKRDRSPSTVVEILNSVGFVMDGAIYDSNLQKLKEGAKQFSQKQYKDTSSHLDRLVDFLEHPNANKTCESFDIDFDPGDEIKRVRGLINVSERSSRSKSQTAHLAKLKKWVVALEAYAAITDTMRGMPGIFNEAWQPSFTPVEQDAQEPNQGKNVHLENTTRSSTPSSDAPNSGKIGDLIIRANSNNEDSQPAALELVGLANQFPMQVVDGLIYLLNSNDSGFQIGTYRFLLDNKIWNKYLAGFYGRNPLARNQLSDVLFSMDISDEDAEDENDWPSADPAPAASLVYNTLILLGFDPDEQWVKSAGTIGFTIEIICIGWLAFAPDVDLGWRALFVVLVVADAWTGARANKVRGSPDVSYLLMVSAYLIAIFLPAFHAQPLPTVLHLIQVTLFVLGADLHLSRDVGVIWRGAKSLDWTDFGIRLNDTHMTNRNRINTLIYLYWWKLVLELKGGLQELSAENFSEKTLREVLSKKKNEIFNLHNRFKLLRAGLALLNGREDEFVTLMCYPSPDCGICQQSQKAFERAVQLAGLSNLKVNSEYFHNNQHGVAHVYSILFPNDDDHLAIAVDLSAGQMVSPDKGGHIFVGPPDKYWSIISPIISRRISGLGEEGGRLKKKQLAAQKNYLALERAIETSISRNYSYPSRGYFQAESLVKDLEQITSRSVTPWDSVNLEINRSIQIMEWELKGREPELTESQIQEKFAPEPDRLDSLRPAFPNQSVAQTLVLGRRRLGPRTSDVQFGRYRHWFVPTYIFPFWALPLLDTRTRSLGGFYAPSSSMKENAVIRRRFELAPINQGAIDMLLAPIFGPAVAVAVEARMDLLEFQKTIMHEWCHHFLGFPNVGKYLRALASLVPTQKFIGDRFFSIASNGHYPLSHIAEEVLVRLMVDSRPGGEVRLRDVLMVLRNSGVDFDSLFTSAHSMTTPLDRHMDPLLKLARHVSQYQVADILLPFVILGLEESLAYLRFGDGKYLRKIPNLFLTGAPPFLNRYWAIDHINAGRALVLLGEDGRAALIPVPLKKGVGESSPQIHPNIAAYEVMEEGLLSPDVHGPRTRGDLGEVVNGSPLDLGVGRTTSRPSEKSDDDPPLPTRGSSIQGHWLNPFFSKKRDERKRMGSA